MLNRKLKKIDVAGQIENLDYLSKERDRDPVYIFKEFLDRSKKESLGIVYLFTEQSRKKSMHESIFYIQHDSPFKRKRKVIIVRKEIFFSNTFLWLIFN